MLNHKLKLLFVLIVLLYSHINAQIDSTYNLKVFGYADVYYAYNFSKPTSKTIPFAYNHNRHNEFNVNNVILGIKYSQKHVRSTIAFHTGTYVQANYASEPFLAQFINEATVGVQLTKKIGIDAGIMPSHIGIETSVSKDSWTLTRSLCAENSPYYQTGIKLNIAPNDKWIVAAYILNGWQNIRESNTNKAIGTQIQFIPNKKILLNYSTFYGEGRNVPDSLQLIRHFHDFYFSYSVSKKVSIASVFDVGFEEKNKQNKTMLSWYTTALLIQYKINKKFATCLRAEYVEDTNYIIGLDQVAGFSLNFDYLPVQNCAFRIEGKTFPVADYNGKYNNDSFLNSTITSSLAISF